MNIVFPSRGLLIIDLSVVVWGSEVNWSHVSRSFHTNTTKGLRARGLDNPAPVGFGAQILSHLSSIRTKIF